jgi:hypothetical protein
MTHNCSIAIGLAALLAGCATGSPGFMHLDALANAGNADAQVKLAHAYADPARFPVEAPAKADMAKAVKWCFLAEQTSQSAKASCGDVMASATPEETISGRNAAMDWIDQSQPWNRRFMP